MDGPLAKSTAQAGGHSRWMGPQPRKHGTACVI